MSMSRGISDTYRSTSMSTSSFDLSSIGMRLPLVLALGSLGIRLILSLDVCVYVYV